MNQPCFCTDPSTCTSCPTVEDYLYPEPAERRVSEAEYRARDARIAIGLPIKQDNEEWEYPGFIDGKLVAFYATPRHADLALNNILDAGAMRA